MRRVFTTYMQEKLAVTVIVITLALFALIYVLYHIMTAKQDSYNQIVLSQQQYDSRVLPYRRGDIVDRNGTYLATTEKVYNLIIDPKQIMSAEEDYLDATVTALVTVFGYDDSEMRSLIRDNSAKAYLRYARQLSYDQKEAFEQYQSDTNKANAKADSKARVKGIWFEDEFKRIYPYNSLACNVVGFATSDGGTGNGGIEQSYNDSLIGTNGREYGYLNDESNLERVIKAAQNGNTVVSSIDVNIQNAVEKRINEWMAETGSEHVGVVVMNPNNGEVLAMANDSMFDLNNPRSAADSFSEDALRELGLKEAMQTYNRQHRKTDGSTITMEQVPDHFSSDEIRSYGLQVAWNQKWRNYDISDTYEPGSPSKIFTVAAALEEGIISPNDTFYCDGYQEVAGHQIKCTAFKKGGHGMLTVAEALMVSCNDAMMQIAAKTGAETFARYMSSFGFGEKTGIDLPGESDAKGLVRSASEMNSADLATNSFGQNYNCSMIQMAAAYCSVINGGSYYEPHVVKQILNDQGSVVKEVKPKLVRETVSESTSNFIKDALFHTVSEGTGRAAAVEGYEIAGKTGTAEKIPRSAKNYLLSFCGFAPAYDPQVLVYVIIDTPHVEDQAHSSYASGVFSKIMGDILPYLNVFPSVDFETQQSEAAAQLPEAEGITDNTGTTPEPETEPKVYETEEYVEPGADSDLPEDVPESTEADGTDETAGSGYVPPAQTVPETSASESSAAESSGAANEESTGAAGTGSTGSANAGSTGTGTTAAAGAESTGAAKTEDSAAAGTESKAASTAAGSSGQERETMSSTSAAGE